ncbi:MAG: hypothetical protein SH850_31560, partial [Planctomycetaceae bacterium]|nr:hypothetical protein [Planctomycetaceae bacterium]
MAHENEDTKKQPSAVSANETGVCLWIGMSETAINPGGLTVEKKSVVRLTDDEREILCGVVKKLKGSSP